MRALILAISVLFSLSFTTVPEPSWAAGARIDDNGNP